MFSCEFTVGGWYMHVHSGCGRNLFASIFLQTLRGPVVLSQGKPSKGQKEEFTHRNPKGGRLRGLT